MFTLKKNSLDIRFDDLSSWLAVTGYILPRTEGELARFEKLYADYVPKHNINEIDFDKIWNDEEQFGQAGGALTAGKDWHSQPELE